MDNKTITKSIDIKKLTASRNTIVDLGKKLTAKAKALKTGQNGEPGTMSPEEVADIVEQIIIPAAQEITQASEEVSEGVPTEGTTDTPPPEKIEGQGNNDNNGSEHDEEFLRKIASLEEKVGTLDEENTKMKKGNLAKKYAGLFPEHKRAQAEKEINDSDEDLEKIEAKIDGASKTYTAMVEAGMIKKTSGFQTYGSTRMAKAGSTEPLPAHMR